MSLELAENARGHWYAPKISHNKDYERLSHVRRAHIKQLLKNEDAVLVTHYYASPSIQALTEETGGIVADSLEMARFGAQHRASTLVVAGVRFMGESAKILSPEKRIMMLDTRATCSLDISCPAEKFQRFCDQHPDRTIVVYANTSAEVKAIAQWVVTSSCAVDIVDHLCAQGKPLIWAPDRYLGHYVKQQTGADMLVWHGSCIVHEEFKAQGLRALKQLYPDAAVLVHPESPQGVIEQADTVGSTSQLIAAAERMPNKIFIVATDRGIFYKMRQVIGDDKQLIEAPTAGKGATCKSCARCPWMAMNTLGRLTNVFNEGNEIHLNESIRLKALAALQRMLHFTKHLK